MKGKETGGITQAVSDKETQMGGRAEEGLMTIYEMNGNTCCNCGKHEPWKLESSIRESRRKQIVIIHWTVRLHSCLWAIQLHFPSFPEAVASVA